MHPNAVDDILFDIMGKAYDSFTLGFGTNYSKLVSLLTDEEMQVIEEHSAFANMKDNIIEHILTNEKPH